MNAVDVQGLGRVYPLKGGEPRRALKDLSFSVGAGELFGVLGPNGGGKTTLFRILSTALSPTDGRAAIFDIDIASQANNVRRRIGVVFQNPSLDKILTVLENILHSGRLHGLSGEVLRRRADEVLRRLGLPDRAGDIVETLSGGLQRRVEIAKSLLHAPSLLLMDEPTTGLDPGARREFWAYLSELKSAGVTILVTTHLMEEADRCDRLIILHEGRRVALGTPTELKEAIGGDVITIQTADPAGVLGKIHELFKLEAKIIDGAVRLEKTRGHEFIPQLAAGLAGMIEAVTIGKPTLEDVFVRHTGHRLWWTSENSSEGRAS